MNHDSLYIIAIKGMNVKHYLMFFQKNSTAEHIQNGYAEKLIHAYITLTLITPSTASIFSEIEASICATSSIV